MRGKGKKDLVLALLAAIVAVLVYANSLGNGFVRDDADVILHNPVLQGTPLLLFLSSDTGGGAQTNPFYRPFTYLIFSAERRLHGFDPFLMHLLNILLHAANVFLVYQLSRSFFDDHRPAFLASLLFAVHPILSESVNYLSGRNTMLASLFVLMAYLMHHRSIVRRSNAYAFMGALLFLVALLSKEFAMMLLPIIIVREQMLYSEKETDARLKLVIRLAPYAATAACYLVLRWLALSRYGIQDGIIPGFGAQKLSELYVIPDITERILNNFYIFPKYLLTIIWPAALSPRYAIPEDLREIAPQLIIGWVCIIGTIVLVLKQDRNRISLFGLSWFTMFWLPVSGIFYFSIVEMADRYLYLPAVGLWIIIADQIMRLIRDGRVSMRYVSIATTLILVTLAALTIRRNLDWKSDITLHSRMVEQYPDNPYGYNYLGTAYLIRKDANDLEVAEKNLQAALRMDPSNQYVQPLLGYIRLEKGDLEGSLYYLSEALRLNPSDREARINRGITYERMGRYRDALADYEYYLRIPSRNDLPGSYEYAVERIRALSR